MKPTTRPVRSGSCPFLDASVGRPAAPVLAAFLSITALAASSPPLAAQVYDIVIAGGRVMDPGSGLDGVRWVGVRDGKITAISREPITGARTIDASGLVVAPGFIDLHVHGQNDENYRIKAMDGVTTALELEVGTGDVGGWYAEREGRALINYGVSASHIKARMAVFHDPGGLLPSADGGRALATQAQIDDMLSRIRSGLREGGLGVGMGIQYTPAATRWEILEMFRLAAEFSAPVFVHVRSFGTKEPGSSVESFLEVIGDAAVTGAPLHIVHLNSMSLASTPETIRVVQEARGRGIDVTTEAYPYSAGMTEIESALLDQYENAPDSIYARMQWVQTGERLTKATFQRYRRMGGPVIMHLNTPDMEAMAITSPLTAIASDGSLDNGKGHPRQAGTFSRVLGHYVRETASLSLMDALRKMTVMPAARLERWAPAFRFKGRIAVGADADIVAFDAGSVADRSTYENPAAPSEGFRHVLVNGVPVVSDGRLVEGVKPGRAVRAPRR